MSWWVGQPLTLAQPVTCRFKGMSTDDFLVYQTIESRQNKGIWTKDIKGATNIHGTALTRILKVDTCVCVGGGSVCV